MLGTAIFKEHLSVAAVVFIGVFVGNIESRRNSSEWKNGHFDW